MKNYIICILLFNIFLTNCEDKEKNKIEYNYEKLEGLDSIVNNLTPKEIIKKKLKSVVSKLNIDIKSKQTSLTFYDEPEYDTINIKKDFDYFLYYEYNQWSRIMLSFKLNYSEIPYYILNSPDNDSLIWVKVMNKKVKKFSVRTNRIYLRIER